ncbi:MAG: DUF481 domain-containing protein [Kiritimatiellae bacterium]|nr:DUF481 domain-containing protein [Kiritimatiellia bacterium]
MKYQGRILVATLMAGAFTSANPLLAQVAAPPADPAPAAEAPAPGWATKVTAGFSTKSGNTESDSYSGRIETGKTIDNTILAMLLEGNYAENETTDAEGVTKDEQTEGSAKFNANVKQRFDGFYLYADELATHDSIADIKLRNVASTGVGTFLADSDAFKFSVDAGIAYVTERALEDDDYFALRFGERIDYKVNETVSVWEKLEVTPEASDFGNTLVAFEAGIESALTKTMAFGVTLKVDHDSEPNEGVERTDTVLGAHVALSL